MRLRLFSIIFIFNFLLYFLNCFSFANAYWFVFQTGLQDKIVFNTLDFFSRDNNKADPLNNSNLLLHINEHALPGDPYNFDHNINDLEPYLSQYGAHKFLFAPVYKSIQFVTKKIPSTFPSRSKPIYNVVLLYGFVSLISALVMSLFFCWFIKEFGLFKGILVCLLQLTLPFFIIFAKSPYWLTATWFLPIVISMWYLNLNHKKNKFIPILFILMSSAFLLKLLFNYEFYSSICIAALVPFVYYYFSKRISLKKLIGHTACIFIASLLAFSLNSFIHIDLISKINNVNFQEATAVFKTIIAKASSANLDQSAILTESKQIGLIPSFIKIFISPISNLGIFIPPIFFLSALLYIHIKFRKHTEIKPLIYTTWFAALAPLSWIILCRPHSYTHANLVMPVVWDISFTFFFFITAISAYEIKIFKFTRMLTARCNQFIKLQSRTNNLSNKT